jgi:hypothetical protein
MQAAGRLNVVKRSGHDRTQIVSSVFVVGSRVTILLASSLAQLFFIHKTPARPAHIAM